MAIALMKLPYAADALSPVISAETLQFHHGKHHQAYVDKTNALIEKGNLAKADLETIIRTAAQDGNVKLYNQAAQVWNHGFYWMSLTPGATQPSADLADRIADNFGSLDQFLDQLATVATDHFGSGWAWLMADGKGGLSITATHDADCPVVGASIPLLTIDVWEHAYYLDRKNDRKGYVKAVLSERINWAFAADNLDRNTIWTYPG